MCKLRFCLSAFQLPNEEDAEESPQVAADAPPPYSSIASDSPGKIVTRCVGFCEVFFLCQQHTKELCQHWPAQELLEEISYGGLSFTSEI